MSVNFLKLPLSLTLRNMVQEMRKNKSELLGMFFETHTTRDSDSLLSLPSLLGNP